MGFRFQKRFRILPGVTINLGKTGVSTSVGVRGARVTFGRGKTRTTVGIPGTGISHTSVQSDAPGETATGSGSIILLIALIVLILWIST